MTPEKKVQNEIINFLSNLKKAGEPIDFERRQAGGFSYRKGIPDIYAVYYGFHIEIEVKAINGRQSTMQEKFEEKCKKLKIPYVCAKNVQDVQKLLEQVKNIAKRLLLE